METVVIDAPSGPVPAVAVTLTGRALQVVTPAPTFGSFRMTPRAAVQAPMESLKEPLDPDVYSAATRAALSVVMSAYE
jgi:hypothetical protein